MEVLSNHKVFLIIVKYIPFILAVGYFIMAIESILNIHPVILPNLFFLSPISIVFILSASFVFKFCIWHRLPIYYCLTIQLINLIDYYSPIVFTNSTMLFIYIIVTIIFILLGMYFKNLHNGYKHNSRSHYNRNAD